MKRLFLAASLLLASLSGCSCYQNKFCQGESVIYIHNGKEFKAVVSGYNPAGSCWVDIRDEYGQIHTIATTEANLRAR